MIIIIIMKEKPTCFDHSQTLHEYISSSINRIRVQISALELSRFYEKFALIAYEMCQYQSRNNQESTQWSSKHSLDLAIAQIKSFMYKRYLSGRKANNRTQFVNANHSKTTHDQIFQLLKTSKTRTDAKCAHGQNTKYKIIILSVKISRLRTVF